MFPKPKAIISLLSGTSNIISWQIDTTTSPEGARIALGSHESCGWVVQGEHIRGYHGELAWDGTSLWVGNPKQRPDLKLNGSTVEGWQAVNDGTLIEAGGVSFSIVYEGELSIAMRLDLDAIPYVALSLDNEVESTDDHISTEHKHISTSLRLTDRPKAFVSSPPNAERLPNHAINTHIVDVDELEKKIQPEHLTVKSEIESKTGVLKQYYEQISAFFKSNNRQQDADGLQKRKRIYLIAGAVLVAAFGISMMFDSPDSSPNGDNPYNTPPQVPTDKNLQIQKERNDISMRTKLAADRATVIESLGYGTRIDLRNPQIRIALEKRAADAIIGGDLPYALKAYRVLVEMEPKRPVLQSVVKVLDQKVKINCKQGLYSQTVCTD